MPDSKKYEWKEISKMNEPRVFVSVVWSNSILYVVGGCDRTGAPLDTVETYDPKTDKWTQIKSMPTKRAAPIVAVFSGQLVAIGGVGETQAPVDAVEIFDPEQDNWRKLTALSEPLMGMAHIVRENRIDLFGGMGVDTNPRDYYKSFVLNGANERWQAMASMPTARYAAQAFHRANKIYVLGGRQGKLPVASFEVYDLTTRVWTVYPNIPTKRVFCNYVMTETRIITLGGLKQSAQQGFSDACEMYSIADNERGQWSTNKKYNMPTKRGDFTAVVADGNKVVVVGGVGNSGEPLSSTDLFNADNKKWTRLGDTCMPRCTSGYTIRDDVIYLISGVSKDGPIDHCEMCEVPQKK